MSTGDIQVVMSVESAQMMLGLYRARYAAILMQVVQVCGYNPQRLLTDQRGSIKRFTDAMLGEPFLPSAGFTIYPHQIEAMTAISTSGNEFVIPRGIGQHRIPTVMPVQREARIEPEPPLSRPELFVKTYRISDLKSVTVGRIKRLHIDDYDAPTETISDYSSLQMAAIAKAIGVPYELMAEDFGAVHYSRIADEMVRRERERAFWRQFGLSQRYFNAIFDQYVFNAMLRAYIEAPWGKRIDALLFSGDRRKRKRGLRLAEQWRRQNNAV